MCVSWMIGRQQFKSPLRILCRAFWRSRDLWKQKAKQLTQIVKQQRDEIQELRRREQQLQEELEETRRSVLSTVQQPASSFFDEPCLPGHQFSAAMIALCCALSQRIGFRATPDVLRLIGEAMQLPFQKIPSRDAVRNWNCRNGVATLREACREDDWIWMTDHSIQLGKMYVLVVLGIRKSQLPRGRTLKRSDLTPLAVLPTRSRDKEEVSQQLSRVAKELGMPIAVLSDEASELAHGVLALKNQGFQGPHLNDVKHKAANLLKKKLTSDKRFQEFTKKLGQTSNAIRQTELEHLLPPRMKTKCRFMNFHRLMDWAKMAQGQLDQASESNSQFSARLEEKLGWLREFRKELYDWQQCRHLIGVTLKYAAIEGVYAGATKQLKQCLAECACDGPLASELNEALITIYQTNEDRLLASGAKEIRLPCSTEVLESAFGSFKALQRHHGTGTFTTLLAVFAGMFSENTAEQISRRFSAVSNKSLQAWLADAGLTNSTQSRRTQAYAATPPRETLFSGSS